MTTEPTALLDVTKRIERLEKQNRMLKQTFLVLATLAACAILMGQAPPSRTIEANEFLLKDASGKVRARLTLAIGGGPSLSLLDEAERVRAVLAINNGIPKIGLLDGNGESRVNLFADAGVSGLTVKDQTGRSRAQLAIDDGEPFVRLYDAKEKPGAVLRVTPEASMLQLLDSGRVRAGLAVAEDISGLMLYDRNGKLIFSAPR